MTHMQFMFLYLKLIASMHELLGQVNLVFIPEYTDGYDNCNLTIKAGMNTTSYSTEILIPVKTDKDGFDDCLEELEAVKNQIARTFNLDEGDKQA